MRTTVEKMIRNLGTDVTVHHNGVTVITKGIFVPTTSRSWQNMQNVFSELGEAPRGQYNYIGAMEPVVEKGDLLDVGGSGLSIMDLGSTNGTIINGQRLMPQVSTPVPHGGVIFLADNNCVFQVKYNK